MHIATATRLRSIFLSIYDCFRACSLNADTEGGAASAISFELHEIDPGQKSGGGNRDFICGLKTGSSYSVG